MERKRAKLINCASSFFGAFQSVFSDFDWVSFFKKIFFSKILFYWAIFRVSHKMSPKCVNYARTTSFIAAKD